MGIRSRLTTLLLLVSLAVFPACGHRPPEARAPEAGDAFANPSMGALCALGIYTAMREVGRRCFAGRKPAFQAELDRSVERLEVYVLKNGSFRPDDLAQFEREQGMVGAPESELCSGDPAAMYEHLTRADPNALREATDAQVSRPGPADWGTCL